MTSDEARKTQGSILDTHSHMITVLPDGCWHWIGSLNEKGYGHVSNSGKVSRAHRVSYERSVGPIPPGLVLDHLCRNTACVNPRHLEPVTQRENLRRGVNHNREKTHCLRGHPLFGENLYMSPGGMRACRECGRYRKRNRR